jgi:hypothetical protein
MRLPRNAKDLLQPTPLSRPSTYRATAKIDALNELAASLIRSGAPVDAVQKFVDAEIDRIEFMQGKNR